MDDVLAVAGRSLGGGYRSPTTPEHAQRVADLTVYVRQHHGERDLAAPLGALLRTHTGTEAGS